MNSSANSSASSTRSTSPTREEIDRAEATAASMCDLSHTTGAGCIKCTGVVSGILRGESIDTISHREYPTVPCPKNVEVQNDGEIRKCNACTAGMAQHDVVTGEGATGPNAVPDSQQLCTCPDKESKARQYYGTEWAGRTAPDGERVPELAICERYETPADDPIPESSR